MANKLKNLHLTKKQVLKSIYRVFLVIIGTFVLAFGTGAFLVPFNLITGGVSGLGILLKEICLTVDIWSYIICWSLFVVGFLTLGVKFTLSTLISTIFYPIFLSIIVRTGISVYFANLLYGKDVASIVNGVVQISPAALGEIDTGKLLIIGLFGGSFVGIGCGITFIGGGSTGGLDIIAFILKKYLNFNVSVTTLIIDTLIIIVGLIVDLVSGGATASNKFIGGLIGIVGAFSCSIAIECIYNGLETSYICDIITSKPEEINNYVKEKLDRTTTIFKVVGGYSQEEKTMLRLVFLKREYSQIKDALAKIDPNAFITFSKAKLVTGEGFEQNETRDSSFISNLIKKNKKQKKDGK